MRMAAVILVIVAVYLGRKIGAEQDAEDHDRRLSNGYQQRLWGDGGEA